MSETLLDIPKAYCSKFWDTVCMALRFPPLDELLARAHVVSIPLRLNFRGISYRETMIFDGEQGPAEWAPFLEYGDDEAAWWLASAIEQGFSPDIPPLPGHIADIPINAIVPAVMPSELTEVMRRFKGVTAVKLKVAEPGQTPIDDVTRLAKLRSLYGPTITIRLDANGAWGVSEAERNLFMFNAFGIDYVEQPVSTLDELARLRVRLASTGIRVAADESLRKGGSIDEILDAKAADLVVLKVNPLGGIVRCLDIARKAREQGVGVVVSSGLETSVGLAHGAHLHALLQNADGDIEDAGLGTLTLLGGDVVTQPLTPKNGRIPLTPPVLDPRKLTKFRATPDRDAWWRDRLRRVYDRLDTVV
jgi:O-succinylbenzoate synthase